MKEKYIEKGGNEKVLQMLAKVTKFIYVDPLFKGGYPHIFKTPEHLSNFFEIILNWDYGKNADVNVTLNKKKEVIEITITEIWYHSGIREVTKKFKILYYYNMKYQEFEKMKADILYISGFYMIDMLDHIESIEQTDIIVRNSLETLNDKESYEGLEKYIDNIQATKYVCCLLDHKLT